MNRSRLIGGIVAALLSSSMLAFAPPPYAQPASTASGALGTPLFAGVTGDGTSVGFSWWAVRGATGYELLEASNPQQKPMIVASLSSTTLGYRDTHPGAGPMYDQLVALGAGGARAASAWFPYIPPSVKSVTVDGADVLVAWTAVPNAPGGYEVWRAPSPGQRAVRVAAVAATTLNSHDKQPGPGPFYYQVVAVGAGGSRAASPWFAFDRSNTTANSHDAAIEAKLAALLAQAGLDMDPDKVKELADAITRGGEGGVVLASVIVGAIAGSSHDPDHGVAATQTGGDPTGTGAKPATDGDPATTNTATHTATQAGDPTQDPTGASSNIELVGKIYRAAVAAVVEVVTSQGGSVTAAEQQALARLAAEAARCTVTQNPPASAASCSPPANVSRTGATLHGPSESPSSQLASQLKALLARRKP